MSAKSAIARPLGDGIGLIELLDHMGDDLMVVNAARVSLGNWQDSFNEEKDPGLLKYMAHHKPTPHFSPFAHPQVQFRVKVPIFVARQWARSNIGTTRNEESRRYVDAPPQFYVPKNNEWRQRPEGSIKQGSGDCFTPGGFATFRVSEALRKAIETYNALLEEGVAPEMARTVLPQSMYVTWIETGSLYYWFNFVKQRADAHAQLEIQKYALAIDGIMAELFPCSWEMLRSAPE